MKKKTFFTEDFYSNPQLTLDVLNNIVTKKLVADHDMYESGEFLYMEAYENDVTKEILSSVISDFEAYKAYNNENYVSDATIQIGLCALQDEHSRFFRFSEGDKEIMWNRDIDRFVFSEDMPL